MNEYREIQVCLLEGNIKTYTVHQNASTSYLLENLLDYLGVKQKIFFGLCYKDESKERYFLNPSLKIFDHSFLRDSSSPFFLHLCIRFFTEDISSITDLVTLNAFFLQTRFDFLQGDLLCYNVNTAYKLSSYLLHFIRASNENFDSSSLERVFPFCLIIDNNFTPSNAWNEIMARYTVTPMLSRNRAIIEFLKLAVKQKGYGVHYFDVKDSNNRACSLGIGMKGICVCECHDRSSIKQFFGWTKMENLFYHERKFSLDVHPENNNMTGSMHSPIPLTKFYSFAWISANSDTAKHLYYTAVTQHQFYLDNYKKSTVTCNNAHMNSVQNALDTIYPSREADNNNNNINNNNNFYVKNKNSENRGIKDEDDTKLVSINGVDNDGDLSHGTENDNEALGKHLCAMLEGLKEQKEYLENLKLKKIKKLQKLSELENELQEVAQQSKTTHQCLTVVNNNRKIINDKQTTSIHDQLSDPSVADNKLEDMEDSEKHLCQQEHITWFYLKLLKHLSCQNQSKIGFTSFEKSDKKWIDKYNKSLQKLRLLEKTLNEQRKEVGLSHTSRAQSFREISPFLQAPETTNKNKTSNQSKSYQNINNESISSSNNISFNIFKGTSKLKGFFRSTNNNLGLKRCLSARPMAFDQDIPVTAYDNEWQSTNSISTKNKNANNYYSKGSIESINNSQEKNKRPSSTRLTRSASSRSTKSKQQPAQAQEIQKPSLQRYQSLEQSQLRAQQQQKLIEQQQKQQILIQQQLLQKHQEQQKQQETIHQQIQIRQLQQNQLLQQKLKQRQLFQKHLEMQLADHMQQNSFKKSREIKPENTEQHLDYASMHSQSSGATSLVFSGLSLKQKLLKKYSQLTNSSYINIATGTTNSIRSNIIISNKNKLVNKNNNANNTCANYNYYNCNENSDIQNDELNNNLTYQNIHHHQDYSAACNVVYNNLKFKGNDAIKDVDILNKNNCKNSEENIYVNTSNQNSFNKYLTLDSRLLRNLKNLKLKTSNFPIKITQNSENKSNSSNNFFITNKQCNNNDNRDNCNVCYNKLYSDNLYTPPSNVISFSEYQKLEERLSEYQPPYQHLFKKSSSSSTSSQLSSPSSLNQQSSSPSSFQSSTSIVINAINPSKNTFSSTVQYKTNYPPYYNAISHANNKNLKKDHNFVNHREVNLSFEEVNESSFDRTLVDESNIDVKILR